MTRITTLDSLMRLGGAHSAMLGAHLIRLAAGIVVIVIVSVLMRLGDLLTRMFGVAPLRGAVGVAT